jgi:hypothetical protein
MSHVHLPELEVLKQWLERNPKKIEFYKKHSVWVGPTESVKYLNNLIKNLNN